MPAGAARVGRRGLPLRAVAAYYAPQGRFSLSGRFVKPPAELAVDRRRALDRRGRRPARPRRLGHARRGRETLQFRFHPPRRLANRRRAPRPSGQPLPSSRYGPTGKARAASTSACRGHPAGAGVSRPISRPCRRRRVGSTIGRRTHVDVSRLLRSSAPPRRRGRGRAAPDDMTVRPEKIERPRCRCDETEMANTAWAASLPSLAYRYERPTYAASLVVQRTQPRLTARTVSCFRVDPRRSRGP